MESMIKILLLAVFGMLQLSALAQQECDVEGGGILELQFTTGIDGILRGNGYCLKKTTVAGGLQLTDSTLQIVSGTNIGDALVWDGTTWVAGTVAATKRWDWRGLNTTVGQPTFTAFGSLAGIPPDDMRVTRNGSLYRVGLSGCTDCEVIFNTTTEVFTFSRALAAGEIIKLQVYD
jgi:hypothetical protein